MSRKRNIGNILLPFMFCAGIVGGIFIGRYTRMERLSPEEEKLMGILGLINEQYVDKVNTDSLLETSYANLLSSLDPHSAYIPKSDFTAVNDELEGAFSGVGVSFQIINDTVMVVEVVPGGPAEKVGILAGDRIVKANDKELTGDTITNEDVFKTLRGNEGSEVALKIKRESSRKILDYTVVRGEIPVNSVDSKYMLNEDTGYLRVTKFARNTYDEFYNALVELRSKGASKFVVDLRGNAGGFLDQAIYMANEFLPAGKMIVYTKGRTPENEMVAMSDGSGTFQDAELVLLTNEFSASASEILAGAIQDNDRGLVIGRRTFGKGLVQNQSVLPDSSAIRLTVARYYTPSGRSIQKEYQRGVSDKYELDILDRYSHGEFYSADSIKFDKSKLFHTMGGREVYGGGGIMPDVFVPEDTTGMTQYYVEAMNRGLIQKYSYRMAEIYRKMLKEKTLDELMRILPRDNTLLNNFVSYAAENGLPAQWYYIRKSRGLLINQLKAVIARDILGYNEFLQVLNLNDIAVKRAVIELLNGNSPVKITNETKDKKAAPDSVKQIKRKANLSEVNFVYFHIKLDTMEKNEIRRKIKGLRQMLSEIEKINAADEVFARLEKTAAFLMADRILMYHSLPDELSTHRFLSKWNKMKRFYLPRVNGVNLEILPYDESRLELGAFHIEEPTGNETVSADEIELVVVPAVAYDRKGNRLGRGKGFYDRLLRTTSATKVGVGYEFQLLDEIPAEPHDVPMDMIITQQSCIVIK